MTIEEKERLALLRSLGTLNRDQVADYVMLLKKEEVEVVEPVVEEPVKKVKKTGKK